MFKNMTTHLSAIRLLSLICGLLLVVSCRRQETTVAPVPGGPDDPRAVRVSARIYDPADETPQGDAQTRTILKPHPDYGGYMTLGWVSGDRIGIIRQLPNSPDIPLPERRYVYAWTPDVPEGNVFSWRPVGETMLWENFTDDHIFYAYYPVTGKNDSVNCVAMPSLTGQNYVGVNARAPGYDPGANVGDYDFLYSFPVYTNHKNSSQGIRFDLMHASCLLDVRFGQTDDPTREMRILEFHISANGLTAPRSHDMNNYGGSYFADIPGTVGVNFKREMYSSVFGYGPDVPYYSGDPAQADIPSAGYFVINPLFVRSGASDILISVDAVVEEKDLGGFGYVNRVALQGNFRINKSLMPGYRYTMRFDVAGRRLSLARFSVDPWTEYGKIEDPDVGNAAPYITKKDNFPVETFIFGADGSGTFVARFATNRKWSSKSNVTWLMAPGSASGEEGSSETMPIIAAGVNSSSAGRNGSYTIHTLSTPEQQIVYKFRQRGVNQILADFAPGNVCYDAATGGLRIGAPNEAGLMFKWGSLIGVAGGTVNGTAFNPANDVLFVPTGFNRASITSWATVPSITATSNGNEFDRNQVILEQHSVAKGTGDVCRLIPGGQWRMPTQAEYNELMATHGNSGAISLRDYNGTPGFWLGPGASTATAADPLGCLFFPVTGKRGGDGSVSVGPYIADYTGFFNSTLGSNGRQNIMMLKKNLVQMDQYIYPMPYGLSIRCIRK